MCMLVYMYLVKWKRFTVSPTVYCILGRVKTALALRNRGDCHCREVPRDRYMYTRYYWWHITTGFDFKKPGVMTYYAQNNKS